MIDSNFISKCKNIFGAENVLTEKADLIAYSYDSTPGIHREIPGVVVFPENTKQVQELIFLSRQTKTSIYPRGAGTCLSGGPVPLSKGVVISFQKMNKIIEIDPDNLTATVQPGVIIADLNNAVSKYGLLYPPDPGSMATATVGGSVFSVKAD